MRKFILLVAVSSTFIMCKKGEATVSKLENAANSADSAVSVASEKINDINDKANAALDSASVKIKDFENAKNEVKDKIENTSKIVDSLSEKISSAKLESKIEKKDSAKKEEKIVVNVPAPKVIKETKIVYKDQPKKENYEVTALKNKMVKSGFINLNVDNAETVKEVVKEEVRKYNGYIKSENFSYLVDEPVKNSYNSYAEKERKNYTLDVKVPLRNFDDLMDQLNQIGDVESQNVEVFGNNYSDNAICSVSINVSDKPTGDKEPKTFGDKSFAAISSGWDVIASVFLFMLPLWPLFLIIGIGYYFYKKRNKNVSNNDPH
ncbi:DUF4349 domain-containing protein [Chryseobacterium sp. MMS23-Vi53]|uniref:DUF4349 domain-containing protein n=1 Tax=Chryseobacterium sp. MMS23-Vi53 TaxID=3386644 RepID=UPI0039E7E585